MAYSSFDLDVPGGPVHVGRWGPDDAGATIVAVHGITGTHRAWLALAHSLPAATALVAVDLRGRGKSAGAEGPYGMPAHADDIARLLDHLGVESTTVVGHSMGGFVSVMLADRYPDRVDALVLVDGGLPFSDERPPPDAEVEALVQAAIGPALDRLDMTFPSPAAYLDFWHGHPAWQQWNEYAEDAFLYDLVPTDDGTAYRSAVHKPAIITDGGALLVDDAVSDAASRISHPVTLVHAERGMFDQVPPLYPDEVVRRWKERLPQLQAVAAPGTNHYTVAMSDAGAALVAAAIEPARRQRRG